MRRVALEKELPAKGNEPPSVPPPRRRVRIRRPAEGSIYDILHEHAGLSLFVRPNFWTDMHATLLGVRFDPTPLPGSHLDLPVLLPRSTAAHSEQSRIFKSFCSTLADKKTRPLARTRSMAIGNALSSLWPDTFRKPVLMPELHLFFGDRVYRDAVRPHALWNFPDDCACSPETSFTTVSTEAAESRHTYSQTENELCNSPMLCYVNRSQLSATRNIHPPMDHRGPVNLPVFRLQKAKAKRTIPAIADHDVQFAAIFLAMAQRHFYPTPPASSTRDSFWTTNLPGTPIPSPSFDNITLHILTEGAVDDDILIVYKGHVTRKFLERFHNPFAAPRDEEGLVRGMRIEYTRVSMKPYLDPQDLGRALGDIITRYQYPTKEIPHYDAVDNGILNEESNCKRRRRREGPDVQCDEHLGGVKKRCLQ